MKKFFCFLFLLFSIAAFGQPIYVIPNASIQPKFVFPIYFEDGRGQKDTLYLGYDSAATGLGVSWNNNDDSAFGVKRTFLDSNSFYVSWFSPNIPIDSAYKTNVSPLIGSNAGLVFPASREIITNKCYLPLKISWDKNLFYSDSLPYLSNLPAPKCEGRFSVDAFSHQIETENNNTICQFGDYILVTDSTVLSYCTARDSMTVVDLLSDTLPINWGTGFYIQMWTGINTSIGKASETVSKCNISPNPFSDYLRVTFKDRSSRYSIFIMDVLGNVVYKEKDVLNDSRILIPVFKTGLYIVEVICGDDIYWEKVVKE